MRLIVLHILSVFLLYSCNYKEQKHPDYILTEAGYYYKLLSFNENFNQISENDFVTAQVQFFVSNKDSVLTSEQFILQVHSSDSACISDMFLNLRQGDSAAFISPNYECVREVLIPEFSELLADEEELIFNVKVLKVQTQEEYYKQQYEYNLWLISKRDFEYNTIDSYIAQQRKKFKKTPVGIYKFILKEGTGTVPKIGELVNIGYQGSLLSGEIINHFTNLEFVYGSEWQVVEGIEKALATMRVGERAIIIVPSEFAWGDQGSSNKEIAPFTTIVFDLELRSSIVRDIEE